MSLSTWNIDTTHSSIAFSLRHLVIAKVRGQFKSWRGSVSWDDADVRRSSVVVEIDAASIDTAEAKRDEHLRSADFFDVANHPTLTFKSTSLKANGKDSWLVTGDLSMRGVTKSVTLPVTLLGEGKDPWGNEKMGFEASTALSRTDYGLTWNKQLEAGGVLLGDEVKIQISIEANKAKPPAAAK